MGLESSPSNLVVSDLVYSIVPSYSRTVVPSYNDMMKFRPSLMASLQISIVPEKNAKLVNGRVSSWEGSTWFHFSKYWELRWILPLCSSQYSLWHMAQQSLLRARLVSGPDMSWLVLGLDLSQGRTCLRARLVSGPDLSQGRTCPDISQGRTCPDMS